MKFLLTIAWSMLWTVGFSQLMVRVTSLPTSTPAGANVHIAGEFNDWSPNDPNSVLKPNDDGTRQISLFPKTGKVEYKFTRGDWASAEGNAHGDFQPNHTYQYDGNPSVVNVEILSWVDKDGTRSVESTAQRNVHILNHNFQIPQLERSRRIWIYLPPDYQTSSKRYPVIYMQDGQNLFDESTANAEEWKVDETLNELFENGDHGAIVVGIDNGGWRRLDEYSPWYNAELEAGGEGQNYVDFLVNTLKPYVDATYKTIPSKEYTGIIGSSMGGLIAHYAAVNHSDVFGKVAAFSPSFWFAKEAFSTARSNTGIDGKYYLTAGRKEGHEMVSGVKKMKSTLELAGYGQVNSQIQPKGDHEDSFWAAEFKTAYTWLFSGLEIDQLAEEDNGSISPIQIRPNPACSQLWIDNVGQMQGAQIYISSIDGKVVRRYALVGDEPVDIHTLSEGMHVIKILIQNQEIYSGKLSIVRG